MARRFQPPSDAGIRALLQRTAAAAKDGRFEKYKTTTYFDGTTRNPSWLGPAAP